MGGVGVRLSASAASSCGRKTLTQHRVFFSPNAGCTPRGNACFGQPGHRHFLQLFCSCWLRALKASLSSLSAYALEGAAQA